MRLPQSQNRNVNNLCIVGNLARMNSKQGGIKSRPELIMYRFDHLIPYHVTAACARTNPPTPIFYLAGYLFKLCSKHFLSVHMQNHCHMDLWSV
jgi:hypothetical protein